MYDLLRRVYSYDENAAERLRSFYLLFYDIRVIVVELVCRFDILRNIDEFELI